MCELVWIDAWSTTKAIFHIKLNRVTYLTQFKFIAPQQENFSLSHTHICHSCITPKHSHIDYWHYCVIEIVVHLFSLRLDLSLYIVSLALFLWFLLNLLLRCTVVFFYPLRLVLQIKGFCIETTKMWKNK